MSGAAHSFDKIKENERLFVIFTFIPLAPLMRYLLSFLFLYVCSGLLHAQVTPYHLNGSAYKENCNCYTLTTADNNKSGSIWNINKIDLNQGFDFKFNVFLGCADLTGADGIVFVLQPISTSIGTLGGGIGYEGVTPSVGVILDTWQNFNNNDPAFDHISIHQNGNIDHLSPNNLAGPVQAVAGSDNIEDCKWHTFRIVWDPAAKILRADIDGVERVRTTVDMVNKIFNGDPRVFWGFTAATGGANNHQRICTSLNPGFSLPANQVTCYPTPVRFIDSSASFGSIVKWYWNFGDGTVDSVNQTPPPHVFPAPGNYKVSLRILGNDGCLSDTFVRTIVAGSKPVAAFSTIPPVACEDTPVNFRDSSFVQFGTINRWTWNISGQPSSVQHPTYTSSIPQNIQVRLGVTTREGCVSDPVLGTVAINPIPIIDFSPGDICADTAARFVGLNMTPSTSVRQWNWDFGDGKTGNGNSAQHQYANGGAYKIRLQSVSDNGCPSVPVEKTIMVYKTRAFAGYDTIAAQNQSITLQASGSGQFLWSPAAGLSDPTILNPVATLQRDATFVLTAYTPIGCINKDTVTIRVFKGPDFYVPNAFTPNGDEKNDRFRCLAVGMSSVDYFNVYNRYGQLVFSSINYQPGWDGTIRGVKQPSGTYVWTVRGKDFTGKIHSKKGTVALIR